MSDIPSNVQAVFSNLPSDVEPRLKQVRDRLFELAEDLEVGPLSETLKWGQPSYLTEVTKAGSTIRLWEVKGQPAVFFTCSSGLVDGFRADFPEAFTYHSNRALILDDGPLPDALDLCLTRALTLQSSKKART